jgi:hypothetical protein
VPEITQMERAWLKLQYCERNKNAFAASEYLARLRFKRGRVVKEIKMHSL